MNNNCIAGLKIRPDTRPPFFMRKEKRTLQNHAIGNSAPRKLRTFIKKEVRIFRNDDLLCNLYWLLLVGTVYDRIIYVLTWTDRVLRKKKSDLPTLNFSACYAKKRLFLFGLTINAQYNHEYECQRKFYFFASIYNIAHMFARVYCTLLIYLNISLPLIHNLFNISFWFIHVPTI